MNTSRWLSWRPKERISQELAWSEPTKPTEPGFDGFEGTVSGETLEIRPPEEALEPLEAALKGQALELWSDSLGERFWLVADEDDAALLGEPRGTIYTATEAHRLIQIVDPSVVAEVHRWKREFNATLSDFQNKSRSGT